MPIIQDCLENVIGLTRNECPCFDEGKPVDADTSLSGYYMDDYEYGIPIVFADASVDCGENGIWQVLERARADGINQFVTDFGLELYSRVKGKRVKFSGWIGKDTFSGTRTFDISGEHGLRFEYQGPPGLIYNIKTVQLLADSINTGTFRIIHIEDATGIDTEIFSVTDPSGSTIAVDVQVALSAGDELYFLYEDGLLDGVKNNKIECKTCGGRPKWAPYFTVTGIDGVGIDYNWNAASSHYANGVRVNGELNCGIEWLCNDWDWENDPWARWLGYLILMYSTRKVIGKVLHSGQVNAYTLLGRDELIEKRDQLSRAIGGNLPLVADAIPSNASACYVCTRRVEKSAILV